MVKNILKEVIIVLLLCVVIAVLLGVIFYDYNPIAKVVPSKIAYTTPENIAEELKTITESNEKDSIAQNKVYTIDGSDLNLYKKSKAYDPSKDDPFGNAVVETTTTTTTTSKASQTGTVSGSSGQTSTSSTETSSAESNGTGTTSTSSSNLNSQSTGKKAKLK